MSKKFSDLKDRAEADIKDRVNEVKDGMKRMSPLNIALLIVFTAVTVCSFIFYDYIFGQNTVFIDRFGNAFANALWGGVPKLIRCIQVVTVILLLTTLVLIFIKRYFTKTPRGVTVAQLVSNLIKWVVAVVIIISVLAVWGVDTTALITGAGVLTLVVGLGLQSLIQDVVAGLFIIFENEFNVGDIITIDDYRGEVVSIGIRTTKLKALGNVKIFNNSDIRTVLNQTADLSTPRSYICVEYASLPRVEKVIADNLASVKVEGLKAQIGFDGVDVLGESGATLLFSGKCLENDFYSVQRGMNMRLTEMLTDNGIKLAFNQVVVHKADEGISNAYGKTVDKADE